MLLSADLINTNGISQIALAFFTALFGMVGWLIKIRYDERKEIRDAKEQAKIAAESAGGVAANTKNVSDGFAGTVLGGLRRIDERLDTLEEAQREHLQWHLHQKEEKK